VKGKSVMRRPVMQTVDIQGNVNAYVLKGANFVTYVCFKCELTCVLFMYVYLSVLPSVSAISNTGRRGFSD
jgi:hypothetical protein